MGSNLFFTILFLISGACCYAQDEAATDITDITRVTLLGPGFGYEKRIAKYQSLYLHGFLSISGGVGYSSIVGFHSALYLDPTLSLEYRYYYNFRRRLERGKRVAMNSLNYLAPFFTTSFPGKNFINTEGGVDRSHRAMHAIGATIGMQRNYKSRFSLDLNIGIGYRLEPENIGSAERTVDNLFYFPGRISFGFWLNKRR